MSHNKFTQKLEKSSTHCWIKQSVNAIQRFEGSPDIKLIRRYFNSKDFENLYNKSGQNGRINIRITVKI